MNYAKLQRAVGIVDKDGRPTQQFQLFWQQTIDALQSQITAVAAAQAAADAANAAADAANTAATTAQSAADSAQTAADEATASTAIIGSYPTGLTLSATDAGATATVTISTHMRVYADGTSVSVTGGSVTGLSYSTDYWIYYDQASRAGGAVTYVATTTETTAAQTGDRHTVGKVTTPAAAAPDTDGIVVRPPGVGAIP